jgi:hypothetical protein
MPSRDGVGHIEQVGPLHDLFSHVGVSQIFKDEASGRVIEFMITEGYFDSGQIWYDADLLIVARKSIVVALFQEDVASELKGAVSEPINTLVPINNIEGYRNDVDALDEKVVERSAIILQG